MVEVNRTNEAGKHFEGIWGTRRNGWISFLWYGTVKIYRGDPQQVDIMIF